MEKSKHNFYNSFMDIPVGELSNFINPINMSLYIYPNDLSRIFKSTVDLNTFINNYFNKLFDLIPSMPEGNKSQFISKYASITYTPHTSGYDFRFSPIDFINNLFSYMYLNYKIPFVNLDNGYGMNYLKDYIKAYIDDFLRDESQIQVVSYEIKKDILLELKDNINKIVDMYYTNLDNMVNNNVIPKDMLLYLANISLKRYEEEQDNRYLVLPYEYYHYVSHMNTSTFPHKINVKGKRTWFDDFRSEYESNIDPNIYIDDTNYILNDHEVLLAWDILKPGMLERQIRDAHEYIRSNPNVDYEKYRKLFEVKMNYYMNSPYVKYIQGKYGLLGYVGFSYMNEYLLFDKFHNSDTIDPNDRTMLTHAEAIYALPSDRFNVLRGSKQGIIRAKERDQRIKKINHTPNYSFLGKLDDIITGPNVSSTTFDKVIEQEKKRMLIRK